MSTSVQADELISDTEQTLLLDSDTENTQLLPPQVIEFDNKNGRCHLFARFGKRIMAVFAICLMLVSWIASAELVQNLQSEYNHPFAICIATRLGWGVCFFGWLIWRTWYLAYSHRDMALRPEGIFKWGYYIRAAIFLSIVGFLSGWTWYISLKNTPVAGNTAVYQTAPVMVFLISVPILKEKVTWSKTAATTLCVAGALIVSLTKKSTSRSHNLTWTFDDDNEGLGFGNFFPHSESIDYAPLQQKNNQNLTFGYAITLLSTFLYAVFEVLYKRLACSDKDTFPLANSQRFLGLVGISVIVLFPLFPILHYTHVEEFVWPTREVGMKIGINVALDTVFNVSLLVTIMLTSPLICSLATILTIPVSMVGDHLMGKPPLPGISYIGVGLIAIGFVCLAFGENLKGNKSAHK
eukprot:m.248651 g.248651  ORF g.248651 m.248651 type:complete len:409 (+) comp16135_c0_seq15:178-1404(+)